MVDLVIGALWDILLVGIPSLQEGGGERADGTF